MNDFDDTDFNDEVTILELDSEPKKEGLDSEISPFTQDLLKVVTSDNPSEGDVLEGLDMDFDDMLVDEPDSIVVPVELEEIQTVDVHGAVGAKEVPPVEKVEEKKVVNEIKDKEKKEKKEEPAETEDLPSGQMMKDAISELLEKIKKLNKEVTEERNRKLRIAADMENLRKRNSKNQDLAISRVQAEMLGEFLPVVDHLEMALQHASESSSINALQEGVQMVLKQFNISLSKFGVVAKDALGEQFDPNIHEAMAQEESNLYSSGVVISQWQKAYVIGDRLIRPARVVVSKGPGPAGTEPKKDEVP